MKHYSSEQWIDYVRGAAPERARAEMLLHLEAGCKKCRQAAGVWTTVLKLAQQEPAYQPPESPVRMAKSYFALGGIREKQSLIPRVARLVFDSFRQPQLAGVRSILSTTRHYVYRSGPMLIDLRMESANDSASVALTGQILDQSTPNLPTKGVPVKLCSGDAEIAGTTTNQFGEFHLEISRQISPEMHLTFAADNKIALFVPLGMIGGMQTDHDE